ncbi:succinate/fumarate mitochondrial transporter [Magnaporthiopsis poae ATCC 64411]|uniref:Succinate/fumarate mitochondrial transporter n=1 Tax=Magnaporthiopsis poae (strain ATCC 64411 / 73-15) TaxID=644358 RepID=A0A0C4E9H6_MAGP6|nr:succinate/fumarate mitochondrial transporter [Magnaporthiopsis poae ATCC 64411]
MATKVAKDGKPPPSAAVNLIAGGGAGMMEALVCHPLDTIKVRMQLSRRARQPGAPKRGFIKTGSEIVRKETPLGLYKGLGAVLTGIVPKMAIRFTSFETYKQLLADKQTGAVTGQGTFLAGLAAGVTEAVAVVTPMEVIKIRLQAQHHSMADPLDIPKYRNAAHALYTVVKEEGFGALYRGVSLTALRQGSNQAVNFTAYTYFKERLVAWQPEHAGSTLPGYQTTLIGLVSGAMGPLSNAPIDTIKTRLQKAQAVEGVGAFRRIAQIAGDMFKQEGFHAFYKGITPRIMRVAPGQAVTFTVYEYLKEKLETRGPFSLSGGEYQD